MQVRCPSQIQEVLLEIQPYQDFYQEITIEDGLLPKESKDVILRSQRQDLLKKLHAGHLVCQNAYTDLSVIMLCSEVPNKQADTLIFLVYVSLLLCSSSYNVMLCSQVTSAE